MIVNTAMNSHGEVRLLSEVPSHLMVIERAILEESLRLAMFALNHIADSGNQEAAESVRVLTRMMRVGRKRMCCACAGTGITR